MFIPSPSPASPEETSAWIFLFDCTGLVVDPETGQVPFLEPNRAEPLARISLHSFGTLDGIPCCCGTLTRIMEKEHGRTCPACGLHAYPRISPAVIMGVTRGNLGGVRGPGGLRGNPDSGEESPVCEKPALALSRQPDDRVHGGPLALDSGLLYPGWAADQKFCVGIQQ